MQEGPERRRKRNGRMIRTGAILALACPAGWGLAAAMGWSRGVRLTFMWLTIALLALLLASMMALPFITRSQDRAWGKPMP